MNLFKSIQELRTHLYQQRLQDRSVALVPTMGALHRGHMSLIERARKEADIVAVSIFVNPAQFNNSEDLAKYPRTLETDASLCEAAGVNILFAPDAEEIYPGGLGQAISSAGVSRVTPSACSKGLCGKTRPGHFEGVTTVVSILFNIFQPDIAVFGEKDYQQLKVIEAMVRELHFQVGIVGAPLVRDADGLALSSRNERLSAAERGRALNIPRALLAAKENFDSGVRDAGELVKQVSALLTAEKEISIDYVEVVDCDSLEPLNKISTNAQLLVAAFVGKVRLIDNIRLG